MIAGDEGYNDYIHSLNSGPDTSQLKIDTFGHNSACDRRPYSNADEWDCFEQLADLSEVLSSDPLLTGASLWSRRAVWLLHELMVDLGRCEPSSYATLGWRSSLPPMVAGECPMITGIEGFKTQLCPVPVLDE